MKDNNVIAKISLPGNNYVIHAWKEKSGAFVRKGETVAITRSVVGTESSGPTNNTSIPVQQQKQQHKRPMRRRKVTAVPKSSDASTVNNNSKSNSPERKPTNESGQNGAVVGESFQQRLVRKMEERNSQKPQSTAAVGDGKSVVSKPNTTSTPAASDNSTSPDKVEETIPLLAASDGILCIPQNKSQDEPLVVAYIEECSHPVFVGGLCVVCGATERRGDANSLSTSPSSLSSSSPYDRNSGESFDGESPPVHSQVTVSGGVTMTVSEQEGRQIAEQDTKRLLNQRKLSLVLDLDHTLVHATNDQRARKYHSISDDVRSLRLPSMEVMARTAAAGGQQQQPNMVWMQHFAKLRPRIKEFLEIVQPMYELTVYTAGTRHYAEEITIVLCRHLVGSKWDVDDLDRLRYELHMAEMEYQKHNSLGLASAEDAGTEGSSSPAEEQNSKPKAKNDGDNCTKKRKIEDMEESNNNGDTKAAEPTPKRKKVSFGPPKDSSNPNDGKNDTNKDKNTRSDHMTLGKLQRLRDEWKEAEELERKARELRQKIFGSRVVSRTDVGDLGPDVKSLKRIFPCGGTMAAVVDDREDVWANASDNSVDTIRGEPPHNLLLVRPYHWQPFVGFADVNNSAGEDLSGSSNNDSRGGSGGDTNNGKESSDATIAPETDVQLVWTSRILRGLHRRFYSQPNMESNSTNDNRSKTVPEILSLMRKEVLKDATIVLSGLVPLHKKMKTKNSARPPIVRYAESLGATVVDDVVTGVTHVVAAKDGTDKALAARKIPGCVLVKPAWLVECYWSLTRRDVKPHLMGRGPPPSDKSGVVEAPPPAADPSQQSSSEGVMASKEQQKLDKSSSDSDSDDDELEAALEEEMMKG